MIEPGVSPTAIEIAAKALYPNGPGDGSDALWFDVVEDVTLVIRALVDSGELQVPTKQPLTKWAEAMYEVERERDRLAAEVTELRAEIARHHADFERWEAMAAEGAGRAAEVERLSQALRALADALDKSNTTLSMACISLLRGRENLAALVEQRVLANRAVLGEFVQEGEKQ